ncbi:hypothetical protein [Streptomyces avermitilis]|nr:hypothetical protein [Streptomyces avermitilis]
MQPVERLPRAFEQLAAAADAQELAHRPARPSTVLWPMAHQG